jgi:hypothetical protein
MKTFKEHIVEGDIGPSGVGLVGGAPTMSVGTGEIAGLGVGKQGEPGINRKKKKSVLPFNSTFRRKAV